MLESLSASEEYGVILRAKGMLPAEDGTWIYFDMVPEETEIREGSPESVSYTHLDVYKRQLPRPLMEITRRMFIIRL